MEFSEFLDKKISEYGVHQMYKAERGASGIGSLNDFIRGMSESYHILSGELGRALHQFVKENGIPSKWPVYPSFTQSVNCPEDLPDHLQGKKFCVPYHYMSAEHEAIRMSVSADHFYRDRNDNIVLKSGVTDRVPYIPPEHIIRDKEYGEILGEAEKLKKEEESLSREIKKVQAAAEEYGGSDSFANLVAEIMIFGFLRMILTAFITLILVSVLFVVAWKAIPGIGSQKSAPIFITIASIVIGGFLAYQLVIKNLRQRHLKRKMFADQIRTMEFIRENAAKERTKLLNSERYFAAEKRQQKLVKEDQELAIRWQTEWKEAILKANPYWLYTDASQS